MIPALVILIILIFSISFYYLKKHYEYWEKRGVVGPRPTYVVGNLGKAFLLKKSQNQIFSDIYKEYPNSPFVGIYKGHTPALIIRDPELIKEITVKSFSHFQDNDIDVDKKVDPLFGRHPFCLKGEEWKTVRAQITPNFTSGKMKYIYPLLEDIAEKLVKFIENQKDAINGNGYEAKELCIKFSLNSVASCAFGLEGKCFEEENSEFRQIAKKFLTPGSWSNLAFVLKFLLPSLTKFLHIKFTSKEAEEKIIDIVSQSIKYREENKIVRTDFLHFLTELKKSCKAYEFTDIDIAAHATVFFVDGYEGTSTVMSFLLYEIAANPQVQTRLRQEIKQGFEANNNKLPYDVLQEMEYLDSVVNETVRMHPPVFALWKLCTKPFTYVPNNNDYHGKSMVIEQGTPVILPLYGLHHDAKYFEDPESFKPERFLKTNKENINKYTYLPFGEGPRACLGQRFGILQIKTGLAHILKNYVLSVNEKTRIPMKYEPVSVMAAPVGGFWLNFNKIIE